MNKLFIYCLLFITSIGIASAVDLQCTSNSNCIIYEFVTNSGAACNNCTVNITIYNSIGTTNQSANFSDMGGGNFRYNAGILAVGSYPTLITGINSSGSIAYSDINLIIVSLSNNLIQDMNVTSSVFPQVTQYMPLWVFLIIISLAILFIIVGYYVDMFVMDLVGFCIMFICGILLMSGNIIYTTGLSFILLVGTFYFSIGLLILVMSIAGFLHTTYLWRASKYEND